MSNVNTKHNITLLVVDGDHDWLEMLSDLVEPHVSNTVIARDGDEALKILGEKPVHLLITDVHLPKMNGVDLLKNAITAFSALKVVVLLDGIVEGSLKRHDVMQLGAEDVMGKRELIDLIINKKFQEYLEVTLK